MSFTNLYQPPSPPVVTTDPTEEPYDINFAYPLHLSILQTAKVKLVPFIPSIHAVPFYTAATKTPDTMRFIPFTFHTINDFLAHAEGFRSKPDYLMLAIIDKSKLEQGGGIEEEDCVAGILGLLGMSKVKRSVEFGPVIVLPEYQRTHVSTHAIAVAMRYILEVPALGGLGWRRVQWTANVDNVASIRCAERMGMKMEAAMLRWSYCLGEEKEGMDAPAERGGGKGRHSSLLAVCWDDWENGVRDHVTRLIERR